ncbi:MAG: tetratricopeptide repeat protein, partial [Brumimicrobium sp.]|nr:tetratricopeptide repeat protein [Brumimicrobium sp.]
MSFNFHRAIILLFVFFSFCDYSRSQNKQKIDSLYQALAQLTDSRTYINDTTRIDLYLQLGKQFSRNKLALDSALNFLDTAIGLSDQALKKWKAKLDEEQKLYLQVFKAKGYASKGKIFYKERMYDRSDSLGLLAIDILKPLEKKKYSELKKRVLKLYANTMLWFGNSLYFRGKYDEALGYYSEVDRASEMLDDYTNQSRAIGAAAIIYKNQGKFENALEYNFRALSLAEKSKDPQSIAMILSNIGILYKNMGDYDKAIDYYSKCIEIYEQLGDKGELGRMYNNMGVALKNQDKYQEALDYYKQALKIARETKREINIISANTNVANVLNKLGKFREAQEYLLEAIELGEKNNLKNELITAYSSLGTTYSELGQVHKCLPLYQKMMKLADELDSDKYKMAAHHKFYEYYTKVNNYEKALEHYKDYIDLRDSLNNMDLKKAAIEKETAYKYQMKKIADSVAFAEQNRMNEKLVKEKEKQLKATKNQQIMLGVVAVLILVFAFFMYNRFKVTQKQHNIIDKQKQIVEHKNKEISDSIDYAKRIQ